MQNRLGTTMGLLVISEQKSFANLFSTHKCRISASAKSGILIHSCIQTLNRGGGGAIVPEINHRSEKLPVPQSGEQLNWNTFVIQKNERRSNYLCTVNLKEANKFSW